MAESSTDSKKEPHVCGKYFQAMLVGGFGAKKREVEEAGWDLCRMLFNYSERDRYTQYHKVQTIVNSATALTDIPKDDVEKVQNFVFEGGRCDSGIRNVIVAHSHGAKIVAHALREDILDEFLKRKKYQKPEIGQITMDIRRCLAVFTIGGIERIPIFSAKIVLNMRLEQDAKSAVGDLLFGGKALEAGGKRPKMIVIQKENKSKKRQNETFFTSTSTGASPVTEQPGTSVDFESENSEFEIPSDEQTNDDQHLGMLDRLRKFKKEWFPPMSAASAGQTKHVLSDYMWTDEMLLRIINALSLDSDIKCACKQQE